MLLLLPLASIASEPVVHPVLMLTNNTYQTRADSGNNTQISFSAMGKDFTLKLIPSTLLNTTTDNTAALPTLLQGVVEGYEQSWARISISNGKPTGYIWVNDHLYQLALSGDETKTEWVMFEPSSEMSTRIGARVDAPQSVTRAIRIGIAIDTEFDSWHQGRGLAKALETINGVDGIYQQQLGLAISIESILELNTLDTDPLLEIDGRLEDVLLGFRDFRATQPLLTKPLSLVHLFSGHRDSNSVVGLGWIDTVCRTDGYDLSVSTPFAFDVLLAAHEISHNLGALHDDDPRCSGNELSEGNTLMVERLNSDTTSTLSPCSLNNMRPAIARNCNLDNIDLALELSSTAISTDKYQRRVTLTVSNTDTQRNVRQTQTRTTFPSGSILSSVPTNCSLNQGALLCQHANIAALASKTVSFVITLQELPTLRIVSTIQLVAMSDINTLNNRRSIDALAESSEAIAQSDGAPAGSSAGSSGLGRSDFILLLILLVGLLRRAYCHSRS